MKRLIHSIALATAMIAAPIIASGGHAQPYPSRPITINVPYAAGGPLDVIVRILADGLRGALGQPIIIENVAGAGGSIGAARAARAAPDGYTISSGNWSSHVATGAIYALPFDLLKDLEPVTLIPEETDLIIGRKTLPANTLAEFIAWLKQNPDKGAAGTSGIGGPSYMSALFFRMRTDTRFQLVPYRGAGPALLDLVAGQIDFMITGPASALPHVQDATVKAYAVTDYKRMAAAPQVPTTDEAGLPGFYFSAWSGFWVPKGTPREIVTRIADATREALADPTVKSRLAALAIGAPSADRMGPEKLAAFHQAEIEKWWPTIKAANVRPE